VLLEVQAPSLSLKGEEDPAQQKSKVFMFSLRQQIASQIKRQRRLLNDKLFDQLKQKHQLGQKRTWTEFMESKAGVQTNSELEQGQDLGPLELSQKLRKLR